MKAKTRRIYVLDELRGFAIICMLFHHAFLDVGDVLGLEWGYDVFDALCVFQPVFWTIFIMVSGICSRLSRNTVKRGFVVLFFGLVITLVTAVIMPALNIFNAQIYFGILHCLGFCMIITGVLMPLIEKINYTAGMAVSAVLFAITYGITSKTMLFGLVHLPESWYQHDFLFPLGLISDSFKSADYFSIIPWIFMFLFGAFAGQLAKDEKFPEFMYKKHSRFLCTVGKNSLWIYIAHQPVLYVLMFIIALAAA